jgi:hypothetical protein
MYAMAGIELVPVPVQGRISNVKPTFFQDRLLSFSY